VIAGHVFTVNQNAVKCFISVSSKPNVFDPAGGNGSIAFDLSPDCSYSASTSSGSFITLTSGGTGSGPGTVNFTVNSNSDADPRAAFITISAKSANTTFAASVIVTELGTNGVHYGDVNGDNVVDIRDLVLLANIIAGNTTAGDMAAADVNFNHQIDISDLVTLANALAGNVQLPVVTPAPPSPPPLISLQRVQIISPELRPISLIRH
jgi:hypothetical protein